MKEKRKPQKKTINRLIKFIEINFPELLKDVKEKYSLEK